MKVRAFVEWVAYHIDQHPHEWQRAAGDSQLVHQSGIRVSQRGRLLAPRRWLVLRPFLRRKLGRAVLRWYARQLGIVM